MSLSISEMVLELKTHYVFILQETGPRELQAKETYKSVLFFPLNVQIPSSFEFFISNEFFGSPVTLNSYRAAVTLLPPAAEAVRETS